MKKILVTGSNGYIGNALVLALLNRKKEFTVRAAARTVNSFFRFNKASTKAFPI